METPTHTDPVGPVVCRYYCVNYYPVGYQHLLFVRERFHRQVRSTLRQNVQNIEKLILTEGIGELYELEEHGSIRLYAVANDDSLIYSSQLWRHLHLSEVLPNLESGEYRLWENSRDEHFYFLKEPSKATNGWIVTAASVEAVTESLYDLLLILLAGVPAAILLALWGGYFWAGRALAPVASMGEAAREISAQDWSRRLPVENPEDELGQLAIVINETFDRLQRSFEQMRQFTADASHELRTPLTALRSVGEVGQQEERETPEFYRNVIGSMLEEVVSLHNHMIDEEPRIFFLHYWKTGNAQELAKGFREALAQTGKMEH